MKEVGTGARLPGLGPQPHHRARPSHFSRLCLVTLICTVGLMVVPRSWAVQKVKRVTTVHNAPWEAPSIMPGTEWPPQK